ncbi:Glycosyl transferase [Macleaya cordata]|uniref:Glycosyl transferase n=1 Tax=Macleaya cordata TaxID=56857 RepID=A0A200R5C0_MACCD|nr:Glycosyl transferase [Macleaya cordata]
MGRNSTSPEILSPVDDTGDQGVQSIRDRFPFKRNPHPDNHRGNGEDGGDERDRRTDRQWRNRSHHSRGGRKGFSFKNTYFLYAAGVLAVMLFVVGSIALQSSLASVFRPGSERERSLRQLKFGGNLKFLPINLFRRFEKHGGLDRLRTESRVAIRPPRLALILGNMKKDPVSLMLFTVMKSLKGLGYVFKIYAVDDGQARPLWEQIGGQISILGPNRTALVDWSIFEGVIVNSLEAKEAISSIMQEPFCSVPLIWIIQEDILAKRLPTYVEMGWEHLIVEWKSSFSRADVVVFPDFSLPMLYSVFDTGNFFVIPGSPMDVWGAESYAKSHSKYQVRKDNGLDKDDLVILVVGSSFFYDKLSWDYAVAMHAIGPLLMKFTRREAEVSFKFVFLCGNSTDGYNDALQDVASRLNLPRGSLMHYGLDGDVNSVLLMADIVLHGSFQDEQGFPPLLIRAMSFEIPVIAPDLQVIKKYVVDGVHGLIFQKHDPDTLMRAFSLLVSKRKLSRFAHVVASSGKLLAKNMLASECVTGYAKLLENVLHFPSDALLPVPISQLQQRTWEWNSFRKEIEQRGSRIPNFDRNSYIRKSSIVYALEEEFASLNNVKNISENETDFQEFPTKLDWDVLWEIESFEDFERRETEELEERMEKMSGSWDEIYRNARKAEKLKFEANERDEGELERIGQSLCIYEIYTGAGSWPSLHHGSLYRGLSLSTKARRSRSDDVDAVGRLPLLNDTYYRDLLCELGGMLAIANRVDNVHKIPWIGFQSWRAAGRKASLSSKAENVLEETILAEPQGDVIYYWACLDLDNGLQGDNDILTFWSLCDIINGGHCRTAFGDAFRQMYGLPPDVEALPPMPEDGGHWSALHSWVMPTPSFLEFVMFSRMFADSLDGLNNDPSNNNTCLLGTSELEKKHCYCRMLELLVNVWAYHSARRMVYIDPSSGLLKEQHPVDQRKGLMWVKFFNFTLLKSMDEDLAEAADDSDHPREGWLWPLTGEVHWQGIYEREREERYRLKMEKKIKTKEKLLERQKYGYKQKTLGR